MGKGPVAVHYVVNVCDPTAYGEEFANEVVDACVDERMLEAATDGLVVAVRTLGRDILDLSEDKETLVDHLVDLTKENFLLLKEAMAKAEKLIMEFVDE